jgi:site-specific recombinase XerD
MLQSQSQPPKLLDQVRTAIRTRHYSIRTEATYLSWIKRFIVFHGKRHPRDMGVQEVHHFLSHLAVEGQVAASTQSQALSAILFLYQQVLKHDIGWLQDVVRAKQPQRLPVVLTQDEVAQVLRRLSGLAWIMGTLLYGAGLRLMECLRLRVKDLDFAYNQIVVRDGKGARPRGAAVQAVDGYGRSLPGRGSASRRTGPGVGWRWDAHGSWRRAVAPPGATSAPRGSGENGRTGCARTGRGGR